MVFIFRDFSFEMIFLVWIFRSSFPFSHCERCSSRRLCCIMKCEMWNVCKLFAWYNHSKTVEYTLKTLRLCKAFANCIPLFSLGGSIVTRNSNEILSPVIREIFHTNEHITGKNVGYFTSYYCYYYDLQNIFSCTINDIYLKT